MQTHPGVRGHSGEATLVRPTNLLVIMSDEHSRRVLGCYGNRLIKTPNLDALAARGTRFTDAYCNSPICVPSRASFATGRYVHQIRFWDNAIPYDGSIPAWGHRLMAAGSRVTSIGKLHYRDTSDPNGFDEEVVPLHVVDGIGDLLGLIREDMPVRTATFKLAEEAGPGPSSYQRYDVDIAARAADWLKTRARAYADRPWVLFVSLVLPHFPLIVEKRFFDLYPLDSVPLPTMYAPSERPAHPYIDDMRKCLAYDEAFTPERVRLAIAAYYGMVTALDENIGTVLSALAASGFGGGTRVIYTSDHGDNLGTRGLWGKSTMYEESAGVPLILAGPEVPAGKVVRTPTTLVDAFPTIIEGTGLTPHPDDRRLPGHSLWSLANGATPERTVLCEYHAVGASAATYMIRVGRYKYVHYVGLAPMLFDLEADPVERRDLGRDPAHRRTVAECEAALRRVLDPEAADRLARADQKARVDAFGGREAVLRRGSFGYSPVPGDKPVYA
ncbi:MAG: sulfatase [Alphaproteobacteria bacterium]|nr:sulfatase [Alphaproteobacteria bacterium]